MKIGNEYKFTDNRYVYNRARKEILERSGKIRCSWCKYHKNENETNEWYGCFYLHVDKNNKVKIKYPNWKLVSKNKKQWMNKKLKKEMLWRDPDGFKFII